MSYNPVRFSLLGVGKVMRACMVTSSRRPAGDSNLPLRRPNTLGSSSIMRMRGALLLAMAVQSRGFLAAPSARVRLGTSRTRASTSTTVMAYDVRYSPNRWKDDEGDIEPGFGGIWPGDPDAKTHKARTQKSNRFLFPSSVHNCSCTAMHSLLYAVSL